MVLNALIWFVVCSQDTVYTRMYLCSMLVAAIILGGVVVLFFVLLLFVVLCALVVLFVKYLRLHRINRGLLTANRIRSSQRARSSGAGPESISLVEQLESASPPGESLVIETRERRTDCYLYTTWLRLLAWSCILDRFIVYEYCTVDSVLFEWVSTVQWYYSTSTETRSIWVERAHGVFVRRYTVLYICYVYRTRV